MTKNRILFLLMAMGVCVGLTACDPGAAPAPDPGFPHGVIYTPGTPAIGKVPGTPGIGPIFY